MQNLDTEVRTIHIRTPVSYICPHCGKAVDPNLLGSIYIVSGHGKFRKKQYMHKTCVLNLSK